MRLNNERHCPVITDITPSGFITIVICRQVKFMSKFGIEAPGAYILYWTFPQTISLLTIRPRSFIIARVDAGHKFY